MIPKSSLPQANGRPKQHELKGKKYELKLSAALPSQFGNPKEIVLVGPYQDVFNEDVEMSDSIEAYMYTRRRLSMGVLEPLLPALFGHVNGLACVIHKSELGKELK